MQQGMYVTQEKIMAKSQWNFHHNLPFWKQKCYITKAVWSKVQAAVKWSYQWHGSLNIISRQLKLCNTFIFRMVFSSVFHQNLDRIFTWFPPECPIQPGEIWRNTRAIPPRFQRIIHGYLQESWNLWKPTGILVASSKIPEISTGISDNFFWNSGLNAIRVMDNYFFT